MRYYLLEYISYDNNKFLNRWKSEGKPYIDIIGKDGDGFIDFLEKYDPSPAKKYVNWMIVRYLKGDIKRLEDIPSRISGALKTYMGLFNKKKLKDEHRDINRIRDIEDVVEEYGEVDVTSKSEIGDKFVRDGEAEIIYDGDDYKIVVPKTEDASCYFGRNTRWCTAARDDNVFDEYNDDGPLYIILHKPSNTRWQFHFESSQYMDERDESINIVKFFKTHKKVFEVFKKLDLVEYDDGQFRIGNKYYNSNGEIHREDGPAVIYTNGRKEWWLNGKRHREDGPANVYPNGRKEWWLNGKRHREDGPAVIYPNGTEYWYKNGEIHREDGPAVILPIGTELWFLNGDKYSYEDWKKKVGDDEVSESIGRLKKLSGII